MRLTVTQGQTVVSDKPFDVELINIGRDWSCQLQLTDKRVAPQHALIVKEDAQWLLEPDDKETVVLLNKVRLTSRQMLNDGDVITIEPYQIIFHGESVGAVATAPAVSKPASVPATAAASGVLEASAVLSKRRTLAQLPPDALICHPTAPLRLNPQTVHDLGKLSIALSQAPDLSKLLSRCVEAGLSHFKAGACYINLRLDLLGKSELEQGRNNRGQALDPSPMAQGLMPAALDRRTRILVGHEKRQPPNALCVPICCELGCIGTVYLEAGALPLTETELDAAGALAAIIGTQLERLLIQKRTVSSSLESSGVFSYGGDQVKLLLPTGVPKRANLSLACYRKPGVKRNSDWFDFLNLPDGKMAMAMAYADAAVKLSMVLGHLRAAFRLCALHNRPPNIVHRELHWLLSTCRECPGYLDLFTAVLDPVSGNIQYCTSGRALAWVFDKSGNAQPITQPEHPPITKELKPMAEPGDCTLPERGTLFLCTPGAPSSVNEQGQRFSTKALLAVIADGCGEPPSEMLNEVVQQLDGYTHSAPPPEDVTMLLLKRG